MGWWNPFASWREHRERLAEIAERVAASTRAERADERAAFLSAVQSMTTMATSAFDANRSQSDAFKAFLDGFATPSSPTLRPFDEDAELARYLAARTADEGALPPDLAGLNRIKQFEMLLDNMDTM